MTMGIYIIYHFAKLIWRRKVDTYLIEDNDTYTVNNKAADTLALSSPSSLNIPISSPVGWGSIQCLLTYVHLTMASI